MKLSYFHNQHSLLVVHTGSGFSFSFHFLFMMLLLVMTNVISDHFKHFINTEKTIGHNKNHLSFLCQK